MPERQLELGLQQRERVPKLVACIRDEAALTGKTVADSRQHLVERLSESGHFVSTRWNRQSVVERRRGDVCRTSSHRLDRPQSCTGEPVAGKRGK